jgi:hypothetical protein
MKILIDLLVSAKSLASFARTANRVFALSFSNTQSKSSASTVTLLKVYSPSKRPVSYSLKS